MSLVAHILKGQDNQRDMKTKFLYAAVVAIAMTACGNSQKEDSREATVPQTQETQTVSTTNETTEPTKTEKLISDDLGTSPKTYTVNGKDITVTKGETSTSTLEASLGEPYIALPSSYTYIWETEGKEYKTKFYLEDGYVDGVKESVTE